MTLFGAIRFPCLRLPSALFFLIAITAQATKLASAVTIPATTAARQAALHQMATRHGRLAAVGRPWRGR